MVGSLALGAVAVSRGLPRPSGRDWLGLVAIGVLWFGVYNVALNQGEHHVDAGTSAMLIQISPVLIARAGDPVPRRAVHALARPSVWCSRSPVSC